MTINKLNNNIKVEANNAASVRTLHYGASADHPRLPCRGCLASCENYHQCNGKPWRAVGQNHS